MDIVECNRNEEKITLNGLIYAVDDQGICHLFPIEKTDDSNSIVQLSNQIDQSLQLTTTTFSSQVFSTDSFSTQPFTIIDLSENHLFHNDDSTPILSPPLQFSGHIASQYFNVTLLNTMEKISTIKKKKKSKYRSHVERLVMLRKQLKSYMKKKKKYKQQRYQSHVQSIRNPLVENPSDSIESSLQEHSSMIDLQFIPDLSKRKYIYKDITLTNQNSNQLNWRIFQCTQQPSSISSSNSTNDVNCQPFPCMNHLPDRRIGLSRHHSIKQLHKMIDDL